MLVKRWNHLLADSEMQPHGTGGRLGAQSRLALWSLIFTGMTEGPQGN